jgi:hypothetical protein
MLCPQCGVKMRPVSVVQEAGVIDRILRHLWRAGGSADTIRKELDRTLVSAAMRLADFGGQR